MKHIKITKDWGLTLERVQEEDNFYLPLHLTCPKKPSYKTDKIPTYYSKIGNITLYRPNSCFVCEERFPKELKDKRNFLMNLSKY